MMANAVSVSITTDAASMHAGDSYIAVTAHWLDAQWNMMSCVLWYQSAMVRNTVIASTSLLLYIPIYVYSFTYGRRDFVYG